MDRRRLVPRAGRRPFPAVAQAAGRRSACPAGFALSDDFTDRQVRRAVELPQPRPRRDEARAFRGGLVTVAGKGRSPRDCSPLAFIAGDRSYESTVDARLFDRRRGRAAAVLQRARLRRLRLHGRSRCAPTTTARSRLGCGRKVATPTVSLRIRQRPQHRHLPLLARRRRDLDPASLADGSVRLITTTCSAASSALKPAIYSAGEGSVRIRDFRYRALPS